MFGHLARTYSSKNHQLLPLRPHFKMQYGGAPGGPSFPGQTQDPLYGYFAAVAGQDGQIDADELQRCLTQSGIAGGYKPFNLETCRLMVSMLDRDMSGTMGFNEFKELWAVLNGWRQHFISFDSDRSGTVDPQELQKALTTMGFRLSPQAVNSIAKRYSTNGKITFDDYIACCVKLRALTDSFRRRDTAQQGVVNFPYDDDVAAGGLVLPWGQWHRFAPQQPQQWC
ncbi:sorcin isoform X1 [Equus asinus]|uniref:sorcin isoform X1 n=1 Tax=Equus asinus TaxID=9793 RepID=UPI0038F6D0E6